MVSLAGHILLSRASEVVFASGAWRPRSSSPNVDHAADASCFGSRGLKQGKERKGLDGKVLWMCMDSVMPSKLYYRKFLTTNRLTPRWLVLPSKDLLHQLLWIAMLELENYQGEARMTGMEVFKDALFVLHGREVSKEGRRRVSTNGLNDTFEAPTCFTSAARAP